MNDRRKRRTYAFDFDGVVAQYFGFKGEEHITSPNEAVVDTIRLLKKEGHVIIIHSTRDAGFLKKYCETYDIPADYFNENPELQGKNRGKPYAYVYVDDRAITYRGQGAEELLNEIKNFKAYWNK